MSERNSAFQLENVQIKKQIVQLNTSYLLNLRNKEDMQCTYQPPELLTMDAGNYTIMTKLRSTYDASVEDDQFLNDCTNNFSAKKRVEMLRRLKKLHQYPNQQYDDPSFKPAFKPFSKKSYLDSKRFS